MGIGTAAFWIVAWAVTFTLPYLYDPVGGAGLGLKIGYIYSAGCLISALFIWLYIGETRGRTLEEINEMFAKGIPARKWKEYRCEIAEYTLAQHPQRLVDEKVDHPAKANEEERVEDVRDKV